MSIFGFSTAPSSGGDFLPVLRYDARAGRFFRVDRVDAGQGFQSVLTDITDGIKFVADFENIEVGWINFQPGSPPSFALVPMGQRLPDRPTEQHKNGVRFMVKLTKECAGPEGKAVREIVGTARAFLSGVEAAYLEYQKYKDANKGKLPVFTLERTVPIKSGGVSSTNYSPVFKMAGWVVRKDFPHSPKTNGAGLQPQGNGAPATGATTRSAPEAATNIADEF